ncbi:MAG: acyl-CoA synthetase [Gammaproteobacteria bacterium]|nr:acyl-CoA synthetase [Gammaproteobacteria bacterium]
MAVHFASAWEAITDLVPNREALVCGDVRRTWFEYDDRAAKLASLLQEHGISQGSKVGIYAHNSNEYLEAQYGIFKLRACPINVNYRYTSDELVYILDNSDTEALFYQACYAARIWEIRDRLEKVKLFVQIADGTEALLDSSIDYEHAIKSYSPCERDPNRSPDDVYMLYTGGTTGMPKGVMYAQGEFIHRVLSHYTVEGVEPPEEPGEFASFLSTIEAVQSPPISLPACPLMHGTGMWLGAMIPMLCGGTVVTISKLGLDPHLIWSEVERNKVDKVVIVGDAFARPMLDALNESIVMQRPYDINSVQQIISSGVMWSSEIKEALLEHHEMQLIDAMGSTEGGIGSSVSNREDTPKTAQFTLSPGVKVFDDNDKEVVPGSGQAGRLATSGLVPLGYYKDLEKSQATFREVDGVRYSFPGDFAVVESDLTITLLGRGSNCINTAGEKVYPEEVEEIAKQHPDVSDCLVVGVPDERFGHRIVAVVSRVEGQDVTERDLIDFAREHIAGYKIPKQVFVEDTVRRSPAGKADYKWARALAEERIRDIEARASVLHVGDEPELSDTLNEHEIHAERRRLIGQVIEQYGNPTNLARALSKKATELGYPRQFNAGQLSYLATKAKFRNIDPVLMLCIETLSDGRITRRELVPELFLDITTAQVN